MSNPTGGSLPAALRALQVSPPGDFTARVLERLGLDATDEFVLVEGPTGPLFVAWNDVGICAVLPAALVDGDPARFADAHRRRFGRPAHQSHRLPAGLAQALRTGRAKALAFDLRGCTAFERAVLDTALDIPPGEVRPYAWVAREIGRPRAVRAVGTALGRNPVPILVPCHRVVRSDGSLGQYGFGPPMKRALLEREAVDVAATEALARAGVQLVGSDTTRVFCYPTCRHARRIAERHRVAFSGTRQALAAGFRPCADCRPAARSA